MASFSTRIQPEVERELQASRNAYALGNAAAAFRHLERAHVLGQPSTVLHVRVHWRMLVWGLRERNAREVFGQALRLVGALSKTPFGLLPSGNTGGANVSPFRPMPVPADLQGAIDAARN